MILASTAPDNPRHFHSPKTHISLDGSRTLCGMCVTPRWSNPEPLFNVPVTCASCKRSRKWVV